MAGLASTSTSMPSGWTTIRGRSTSWESREGWLRSAGICGCGGGGGGGGGARRQERRQEFSLAPQARRWELAAETAEVTDRSARL